MGFIVPTHILFEPRTVCANLGVRQPYQANPSLFITIETHFEEFQKELIRYHKFKWSSLTLKNDYLFILSTFSMKRSLNSNEMNNEDNRLVVHRVP